MLVAFRYHLQLDAAGNDLSFDVFVAPLFGFYGFLIATTLSLVLGHVMIYYHRRDALHDTLSSWSSDESVNVFTHRFKLQNGRRGQISKAFAGVLGTTFIAIVALLSLGMTKQSFSFDFGGVAGYLLGVKKNHISYSVLSLWQAIPESVDGGGIAAKLLQAAFFFYTIATPFVSLMLLATLAVCPLTLPGQVKLLSVATIANSWSALEVFVLSILAALFEISTFSNFIVGDKCYLINEITAKYTQLDDPSCFRVSCTVTWDALFLITGTILFSFWSMTILQLTRTCIVERITNETSNENDDEWSFLACLAERFAWIVVDEDLPLGDDTGSDVLPVIADERIGTQNWAENPSDSGVWDDTTREDPTWKEWKETTNVT
jgi:Paraquat-inducible protein A